MTPEHLDLIDKLQRDNADSEASIAERVAAREADPNSAREQLLADRRVTGDDADLAFTEPTDGTSDDPDIVYKTYDNSVPPEPAEDWTDTVSKAIGLVTANERMVLREELRQRDERITRLEAQVEMMTMLLGNTAKSAGVNLRGKRRAA